MTVQLNPYLGFATQTREAMGFYHSVLGGELTLSTYGDSGAQGAVADLVMHAQLRIEDGMVLMASDRSPEAGAAVVGNAIALCLNGSDADRLRACFAGLAEGGHVDQPLERMVWGDEYGGLTDRFGHHWMVNIVAG